MRFKNLLLPLIVALVSVSGSTYAAEKRSPAIDNIYKGFANYYGQGIDEKLYLQTDKPYYSAGEQIWIKGYLRNAITHAPLSYSNFIYVELLKGDGELVSRIKIKRDNAGFNGYIAMDPQLEAGDYMLRGYTLWMMNKDEEFFFNKKIEVVSPIPVNAEAAAEAAAKEAKEASRRRNIKAAAEKKELKYDLQFFPEGGSLLASGTPQVVAFKALGEDGLSVEVKGAIYNQNDDVIAKLETTHKGMGVAHLFIKEGEVYHAVVKRGSGEEQRFELPAVAEVGAVLKVSKAGTRLFFQAYATDNKILKGAHIVVHSRGRIVTIAGGDVMAARYISTDKLGDGISVISLIDKDNEVMSERVIFNRPAVNPALSFKSDASNYAKRSRAIVTVNVKDSNGMPAKGEFGVSVTDNSSIEYKPEMESIISYLLLSSEIKGHIEDPGAYFASASPVTDYNLDLLMMTQGWRRFDLGDILSNNISKPTFFYENMAQISGNVKGFFGNAARKPKIFVLCSQLGYVDTFDLDESSTFKMVGVNIPDSTTYIVQAQGRNGGKALTLNIDKEIFAGKSAGVLKRELEYVPYVPQAFVNQSQEKFYYEGGMNMINLETITVSTTASESEMAGAFSTQSTSRADLESFGGLTLEDIIRTYPSMEVVNDSVMYRGGPSYARFIVDGMDAELTDIKMYTAEEIERIDFFSGVDAVEYSDSAGGVFVITLREGVTFGDVPLPNIAYVSQLGYQRPAVFYQPSYDNPSLKRTLPPDMRTTIYWNGALVPDAEGNITFDFFTADKATNYTVKVEGMTDAGEICQGTTTIERTLAN